MKGMSIPILVVVAAIVILVVALVLLTIFGAGIGSVGTITDATNLCRNAGAASCASVGSLPPTWGASTMNVQGTRYSCARLAGCKNCIECKFKLPPGAKCSDGIQCQSGKCVKKICV